jgi:tol-pal system protein YbgF
MNLRRMRISKFEIAAALAAVLLVGGCSTDTDIQQLNQNEFTLRGMIASDRQQIDSLQQQVKQLNDQITELKHEDTSDTQSDGGNDKGLSTRVAQLESEVSALNAGMVASSANPAAAPSPGAEGEEAPPPGAVAALAPGTAAQAPAAEAPAEIPPTWPNDLDSEIESSKTSNEDGIKLYRKGLDAMKAQNYPLAVANFTRLQHQYPKSELSEPAEYFAANALFETGKYEESVLQFNDLVMRYPKGRFASAALLREAQAFLKLNDQIDARLTLQKLVADHGGTPEANSANTMLKQL